MSTVVVRESVNRALVLCGLFSYKKYIYLKIYIYNGYNSFAIQWKITSWKIHLAVLGKRDKSKSHYY